MMNPLCPAVPLSPHERNSLVRRMEQIEVALGHPRLTPAQSAALIRERDKLQRKLADAGTYLRGPSAGLT